MKQNGNLFWHGSLWDCTSGFKLALKPGHLYHFLVCSAIPSWAQWQIHGLQTFALLKSTSYWFSSLLVSYRVLSITKWTLPNTIMSLFSNIPCLSSQWKASKYALTFRFMGFPLHSCFHPCPLSSSSLSYRSIPTCVLQKRNMQQVLEKGLSL